MLRSFIFVIHFVYLVGLFSCGEKGNSAEKFDLKKLEGDWLFMHESTLEMAQWRTDDGNGLSGTGYVLDGTDTTFIEFLQIKNSEKGLVYYASASRADTINRVPYTLLSESAEKLEFFNGNCGFPQKIVFNLPDDSTMYFYIEGPQEQKNIRINFIYQKLK